MQYRNSRLGPLPDYLRRGLKLVFIGFNPGLHSARLGHYYAGRGNQFWPLVFQAGLVPEALTFRDDARLLEFGLGLTDIVKRPSRGAHELTPADYRRGRALLGAKLRRYRPQGVAFVGKDVYERFMGRRASLGPQTQRVFRARVFVLPSTAGTNTALTRRQKLGYFQQLRCWLTESSE